MGIFFENFLISFSSFFEKPVVPIITLFLSLDAIFSTSKVHFGIVKSIIKFALLNAFSELTSILIPLIFLSIILPSVRETNLKLWSSFTDLIIC